MASAAATGAITSERKKSLDLGAATAVFALAIMLGWLCLPKEAKHPGNARRTVSLLLSFATFLAGDAIMLLSFTMLGLRDHLVSTGQRAAAKILRAACPAMSVLTLLCLLLALLPATSVYLYVGLAFIVTVIAPAVAATAAHCCYPSRHRADDGDAAAAAAEEEDRIKIRLDAASKVTSCVTCSAFGGIVGVLFSVSKVDAADAAANSAVFFMFATAILGVFVTTASKKAPEIRDPRRRRLFVAGVRLANALLLCALACAALAASFAVLRCRVLAALAPLLFAAAVSLLHRHCVARRRGGESEEREDHEARIEAMEDVASKMMAATLGGIMSVLGGWLSEKDGHATANSKWGGALEMSMLVLTSAFVSSFGFMALAAALGSARERLAPVANVLIWSTAATTVQDAVRRRWVVSSMIEGAGCKVDRAVAGGEIETRNLDREKSKEEGIEAGQNEGDVELSVWNFFYL